MFILDVPSAILGMMFFSGFWPFLFSVIFIIAAIISSTTEAFGVAYTAAVLYAILLAIFTSVNPFMMIWNHPAMALGFIFAYIAVGALYSVLKYSIAFRKIVAEISELKAAFIKKKGINLAVTDPIPELMNADWKDFKRYNGSYRVTSGVQKETIINWIAFWPFSAVGIFVADPLQAMVTGAYNMMVSTYKVVRLNILKGHIHQSDLD